MSYTVFLGNLPSWVTADDIKSWLTAENLVADQIKVIRNPETQESKGFAFIEAPNQDEMQAIIRRFDRAPLEDRLLRANPAQPPRTKRPTGPPVSQERGPRRGGRKPGGAQVAEPSAATAQSEKPRQRERAEGADRADRGGRGNAGGPQSAFAEELAKAL
jgi:RNA recognition motif-containing protein